MLPNTLPTIPLSVVSIKFTYRLDADSVLPRWKGAMLRGGFGRALERVFCDPHCDANNRCSNRFSCPYYSIFAPEDRSDTAITAGARDTPRPYVIRPPLDAKTKFSAGEVLSYGLVLVGTAIKYLPHVISAFQELGVMGLGEQGTPATLLNAESINPLTGERVRLFEKGTFLGDPVIISGAQISALIPPAPTDLILNFLTPLRVKHVGQLASSPECHVLVRASLRRLSDLSAAYGDGPWTAPYADLIRLAETVRMKECKTHWVDWTRTSGASGQHMILGGLVGSAYYAEIPPAIHAVLKAGSLVHIGKAAVFGHGAYRIVPVTQKG